MQEGSYRVSGYFFLKNPSPGAQNCRERSKAAACGMEPSDTSQVFYGAVHSVPRATQGLLHAFGAAEIAIVEKDIFPFGLAAGTALTARAGPPPLYLQNLSLLI